MKKKRPVNFDQKTSNQLANIIVGLTMITPPRSWKDVFAGLVNDIRIASLERAKCIVEANKENWGAAFNDLTEEQKLLKP